MIAHQLVGKVFRRLKVIVKNESMRCRTRVADIDREVCGSTESRCRHKARGVSVGKQRDSSSGRTVRFEQKICIRRFRVGDVIVEVNIQRRSRHRYGRCGRCEHGCGVSGFFPEIEVVNVTPVRREQREQAIIRALIAARKGDHATAASLAEPLLKDAVRSSTIAAATVALGLGQLEQKKFSEALKAFLELPVFLPDETALSGIARLGAAQAYFGMEDYDRAIATLEELIKTQPGIPQISTAESLLPEWTRRRRAVQNAKAP